MSDDVLIVGSGAAGLTAALNLAETRKDWERDVPVWIKLAVDLGIKLD